MARSNKKKRKRRSHIAVFIAEVVVLLILVSGIFVYAKINSGLSMIGTRSASNTSAANAQGKNSSQGTVTAKAEVDGSGNQQNQTGVELTSGGAVAVTPDPNADADAADENVEVTQNRKLKGYTNIALVGIDSRESSQLDYANSDTMIICSINNDTGAVRMVSVYRDTLLNIGNKEIVESSQGDSDDGEIAVVDFEDYTDDDGGYDDGGYDDGGYDDGGYDDGGYDDGGYDDGGYDDGGYADDGSDEGTEDGSDEGTEGGSDEGAEGGSDEGAEGGSDEGSEGASNERTEGNDGGHENSSSSESKATDSNSGSSDSSSSAQPKDTDGDDEPFYEEEEDPAAGDYSNNDSVVTFEEEKNDFSGVTTAAGRYDKANAAYCNGSAKQLLSMLNRNLDLNIHDYIVVDFNGVALLVDDIDGIDVWMTKQEVIHMNNYCVETSKVTGLDYEPIEPEEEAQYYHLNGVQAVSYARIRYTVGNDMKRTQRQRVVIEKVVEKAKKNGLKAITGMINDVFPLCKTSLSNSEIIRLASMMFDYEIEQTGGFPFEHLEKDVYVGSKKIDCVVPVTLEQNVKELHEFLFDEVDYQCSANVLEFSKDIESLSNLTEKSREAAEKNSVIGASGGEADIVT